MILQEEIARITDKVFKEVIEIYKPFDFQDDGIAFNKLDLQISISLNEFHQRISKAISDHIEGKLLKEEVLRWNEFGAKCTKQPRTYNEAVRQQRKLLGLGGEDG